MTERGDIDNKRPGRMSKEVEEKRGRGSQRPTKDDIVSRERDTRSGGVGASRGERLETFHGYITDSRAEVQWEGKNH